ncbi:HD-GYP domain-containing protein [Photobacterium piscicola]|uniref:HD domain-containing phosphohydrolase n=1 Tax=Photobacterium piscicola TaxID=1378299 RepID=A0ABU6LJU9_9GAMM|nr:HD domain-containing phosphohydrolase [Photobacterium piscicola]MEC6899818.1 HD domain-containing phosphohydrolase [Photobacterium piscicola]
MYSFLNSTHSLNTRLNLFVASVKKLYPEIIGIAVTRIDEHDNLYSVYRSPDYGDNFPTFISSISQSPRLNKIRASLEPSIIDNMLSHQSSVKQIHLRLLQSNCISSMACPIYSNDIFIGVLFINAKVKDFFSEKINYFTTFSILISLLIADNFNNKKSFHSIVKTVLLLSHHRDPETQNHLKRVAEYSRLIGLYLAKKGKCNGDFVDSVYHFSDMHDIGKSLIPEDILYSTKIYTDEERAVMNQHPELGCQLLSNILTTFKYDNNQELDIILNIIRHHHERYDGNGYPYKLKGTDIPLEARIVTVADVIDALLSHRPYKQPWSIDDVELYLINGSGTLFDPLCIDAILYSLDKITLIQKRYPDVIEETAPL